MVPNWCTHAYTAFMPKKPKDGKRLNIRISSHLNRYLGDLADLGVHGSTRSDVARTLLTTEVERLIREGFLKLRPAKNASGDS
jgi:hypothetical protein